MLDRCDITEDELRDIKAAISELEAAKGKSPETVLDKTSKLLDLVKKLPTRQRLLPRMQLWRYKPLYEPCGTGRMEGVMAGINQSASASAEANLAKISGNTFNFIQAPASIVSGPTGIAKAIRTIAPVWYEEREAKALSVRAESLATTAAHLKEMFPAMSERRAVMEALGYPMQNKQADNVIGAMSRSQEELKSDAGAHGYILPEARDAIIEGSKGAYDENARVMWAKLIAGEMRKPGTFSKKSMSILSEMNSEEAKLFEKLCSFCIELNVDLNNSNIEYYDPIVVLIHDDDASSYNNGSFSIMNINRLELLGLVATNLSRTLSFHPNLQMPYRIGERVVLFACKGENEVKVRLDAVLTNYGTELSRLCDHGASQGAIDVLKKVAEKKGLTMKDAT